MYTQAYSCSRFPIQTPKPEVQNLAGPLLRIGCATLNFIPPGDGTDRRNLRVIIPKSDYTLPGETITLSFAAYTDETPPVLVPGTDTTATLLVSDPYPDAGLQLISVCTTLISDRRTGHMVYLNTPLPDRILRPLQIQRRLNITCCLLIAKGSTAKK